MVSLPSHITHIFFDLDHTLWDFDKNSAATLSSLLQRYGIAPEGSTLTQRFISQYKETNKQMWQLYNHHRISKDELRFRRFREAFGHVGIELRFDVDAFGDEYVEQCTRMPHVFDGVHDLLQYASEKYSIAIITNGFLEATHHKLKHSGLHEYFKKEYVFITENIGFQKPHPKVFEVALELTGGVADHSVMVGDNLESDIGGAYRAGICPIWFNPHKEAQHAYENLLEVNDLSGLKQYI